MPFPGLQMRQAGLPPSTPNGTQRVNCRCSPSLCSHRSVSSGEKRPHLGCQNSFLQLPSTAQEGTCAQHVGYQGTATDPHGPQLDCGQRLLLGERKDPGSSDFSDIGFGGGWGRGNIVPAGERFILCNRVLYKSSSKTTYTPAGKL